MITLGINYNRMHDSSACIASDGKILFAVAEERISRVKHDARFPSKAIRACLDFVGINASKIEEVCFGWPTPWPGFFHDLKCLATGKIRATGMALVTTSVHCFNMLNEGSGAKLFTAAFPEGKPRFRFVDHHFAHAVSAYFLSGLENATVLILDGRGAWEATSIWHGSRGRIRHVLTIPFPNSIGLFYSHFTDFLGFHSNSDEWKVMGLAPYGEPGLDLSPFILPEASPYRVNSKTLLGRNGDLFSGISPLLGAPRAPEGPITDRDKNVAYAVQDACERAMLSVVRLAIAETGVKNLCLAGGVALNSKANGRILTSGLIDNIFVQPAASDDGVALGAALVPFLEEGGDLPVAAMRNAYLGPGYDDEHIVSTLEENKIRFSRLSDPAATAAELLAGGKILGWYQDRMEFGPRALGDRSILADPRDPEMNTKVNNAVKFRESWRPFAPSLIKEAAAEYLESAHDSPFMILTANVRPEKRNVIPAVTHVDGSARPQTVERATNPLYYRLIEQFGERTGVPVIMNTSFNLRGEAIVNTPTDAIQTFVSSGLDALVIGSFLVEK
jgi:carbamoyltransferase